MKRCIGTALAVSGSILVYSVLGSSVLACPASPNPVTVHQPDGTPITLRIHGDKYYHWFEDMDGYTVVLDQGTYKYARLDAAGRLAPTPHLVGHANPRDVRIPHKLQATPRAVAGERSGVLVTPPGTRTDPVAIPPIGTVKNLVVLCRFADHEFGVHTRPQADYDVLFNAVGGDPVLAPSGSVRDAFDENSYGILELQSTVAAWVTLPHDESYYTGGTSGLGGTYPQNPQGMVEDALNLVDFLVDFGEFDQDNDGYIDAISIVHSGYGAETGGGGGDWMWSHRWSLWALPGGEWTSNDTNSLGDSVRVYDYHTEPALWGTSGTEISRIGVIVHETGHFFGLPDFYDTNGGGEGIGSYAMMANSWGFDGSQLHPPHFCAYSKVALGWSTTSLLTAPGIYDLNEAEFNAEVYRIDTNFPAGEYLLVENRQPVGIETAMPQGGLCIWHVDLAKCCNTDEGYPGQPGWPGNNNHYRIALLQADGDYDLEKGNNRGDGGDVYHAGGVNAVTSNTVPNTDSYQSGNVFVTNNAITNISAAGSTMSFTFGTVVDCNGNEVPDDEDISSGTSEDCNVNTVPDECELGTNDCNGNTIPDDCDILGGETDCNNNGVPDLCETSGSGELIAEDFEAGLPGNWTAQGIFHITGSCSASGCNGNAWAYAGSDGSCTYGDSQSGELISPSFTLSYGSSMLNFCHRLDTEADFDFCRVYANGIPVWEGSGTDDAWHEELVDLSVFNGQTLQLTFQLASDAFVSGTLGWQIDSVSVVTGAADCNSNNVPDDCDITSGTSADDNEDGIPDECTGCVDNSDCDDGLFCNGAEVCNAGACVAGLAVECDDGIDCTSDSCNESTDACVSIPNNDACDNGLYCDGPESCEVGVGCVTGLAPDCNDGIDCTVDACDELSDACTNDADHAACDNGLFCDGAESCQAGVGCIAGTAPDCNDGIGCTDDACNEDNDTCTHAPNNAACDNGLFCDGTESCQAGVGCVAGTAPDCNDDIGCTDDSCDEDNDRCTNAPNDAACDNGLFCDGTESCLEDTGCIAGTAPVCNDGISCTADTCDEQADACINAPDDAVCDNGQFCDGVEVCEAGIGCTDGPPRDCSDGVDCTNDLCDEVKDRCITVADNASCDNGLFCDGTEICNLKIGCTSGPDPCPEPLTCDEDADQCDGCLDNLDCDDGNVCTDDACVDTQCENTPNYDVDLFCCNPEGGQLQVLDDNDPCTDDTCDTITGSVIHTIPNPDLCGYEVGGRFLTIIPTTAPGVPVSLLVSHDTTVAETCFALYVQSDGSLDDEQVFQTPEAWGAMQVSSRVIVPETTYIIQVDDGGNVSSPLLVTTSLFGDVDRNGVVNFADIQQTILIFQQVLPYDTAADLKPCDPNFIVNLEDTFAAVQGFRGFQYEETTCNGPCP
ncbi:MAG: M6 family metalloprotease domain-containing protein [Planctomycetota bacterium]|jgi:M6 family metalloprotease-like protein